MVSKTSAEALRLRSTPAALVVALSVCSPASRAEERIDTAALGNRGVTLLAPTVGSPGIHTMEGVGDVDGDGFDDIAIGLLEQRYEDAAVPWAMYLVYGRPRITGEVALAPSLERSWTVRAAVPTSELWAPKLTDAAPLGDLDGDGYGEFLLGYGIYPDNGAGGGTALLVRGGSDLVGESTLEELLQSERVTVFRSSELRYQLIGSDCDTAGDFDGDGVEDIALTASGSALDSTTTESPGAVFVILGGQELPRTVDVARVGDTVRGMRIEGFVEEGRGSYLGSTIASIGDFDGDGLSDLAVTASRVRRIYVILGRSNLPAVIRVADAAADPSLIEIHADSSTITMARLGDVNADGFADFAMASSPGSVSFVSRPGWVQVLFGAPGFPQEIDFDGLATLGSRVSTGARGARISAAPDFDGDRRPDLVLAASRADSQGRDQAGEAYVLLAANGFDALPVLSKPFPGVRIVGALPMDNLGGGGPAGDFDGDGFEDLLLAANASRELDENQRPTRAFLIYGGPGSASPLSIFSAQPERGPAPGGTEVTLRGSGFAEPVKVAFGERDAVSVTVVSPSEIRAVTPPADTPGFVDVIVTVRGETAILARGFQYTDPDLPEIDLARFEGHGFALLDADPDADLGTGAVAFGDLTGDGIDELIVGGSYHERLFVSVVIGGADLPATLPAFETSPRVRSITSLDPEARSATAVLVPGDLNADGFNDLLVSTRPGQAVLLFGRSNLREDTRLEDELFVLEASRLEVTDPCAGSLRFARTGDVTGDGIDDVAIAFVRAVSVNNCAVPREEEPLRQAAGELIFVAGRRVWPEELDLDVRALVHSRLRGPLGAPGEGIGWSISPLVDANGDGLGDVLVSQRRSSAAPAYLVYGSPDLPEEAELEALVGAGGGATIELEAAGEDGTLDARSAGDLNGDGLSDIVLSHDYRDGASLLANATLVLPGRSDLPAAIRVSADPGGADGMLRILNGEWRPIEFGNNAAAAGDFNADGFDDLVVSRWRIGEAGTPESPSAFVILGGPDRFGPPGAAVDLTDLRGGGLRIAGRRSITLTPAAQAAGDLNGDGLEDFAILEARILPEDQTAFVIYGIPGPAQEGQFLRGDANADARVDLADTAFTLAHLFAGGARPVCEDALDANDDGALDLTDAVYLFVYLFNGGSEPPPPFVTAGTDPSEDGLTCARP